MEFDCVLADLKLAGDQLIRQPLADQLQYFALAGRQWVGSIKRWAKHWRA